MTKTPDTTPQPNYPDQIIGDKPQPGAEHAVINAADLRGIDGAGAQPDQDGFVQWLSGTYSDAYNADEARRLWRHKHISALAWEAAKARYAAQPARGCLHQSATPAADLQPEGVGTLTLTQERLKAYLNYDPDTGIFTSRATGKQIGWKGWKGYVGLCVYDVTYRAHRLAWLYMTGEWPADLLDHCDGDRSNNRFSNLRESTHSQNAANGRSNRSSYGLPRGVRKSTNSKSFKAEITVHNRRIHLGNFTTAEEASEVYNLASELIHGDYAYHISRNKASAAQGANHVQ